RATARCQVVGQERFGYFCATSKVTRCKSATNISRYVENGYVHKILLSRKLHLPTILTHSKKTHPDTSFKFVMRINTGSI
ncbi:hypothetical protein, partial [Pseudomonas folii]|uniref:hypothetical protein n=1 Tax=Pseudomonas folii TaxID=2762593 RepID=UPI001BE3F7FC